MHARFQNMRSDWKYKYWKYGHFLNAEILNSENWLKIHIHSKSTQSFGPLQSFGPVIVIRTPIRKDPRADSQIKNGLHGLIPLSLCPREDCRWDGHWSILRQIWRREPPTLLRLQHCCWFSVNRKYFVISCICAQKQYVDFRSFWRSASELRPLRIVDLIWSEIEWPSHLSSPLAPAPQIYRRLGTIAAMVSTAIQK